MPYEQEISVAKKLPGCIVFLLDQSTSMDQRFGGDPNMPSKAHGLCDAINRLLDTLTIKCTRTEAVRDYFDVAVIGYSEPQRNVHQVGSALSGDLGKKDLVTVAELADNPIRIEPKDVERYAGAGSTVKVTEQFPVWVDPVASGGTPMNAALAHTRRIVEGWIAQHRDSYPPIVIHITDGESTDGDPVAAARQLTELVTSDGNVLLFNCHVSSHQAVAPLFPDSDSQLPADPFARTLFEMSSVLPPRLVQEAQGAGFAVTDQSRGFAFNADLVRLIQFLDIGTRIANALA